MHLTIVGTGYVGLVTGACLANMGNDVTCLDVDPRKVELLQRGQCPIYEPGLEELIRRNLKAGRLRFTTEAGPAYASAEVIFLCVGTPNDEKGQADLRYVLTAAGEIGRAIEAAPAAQARPKIVVVKSTVPVGTGARVKAQIAACTQKPFRMAANPEFLKEGAAIADFNKPDRVILGVEDKDTGDRLRELYEPFVRQGNPIFLMDIASAEMVKYASNAMLATKISFINEIANLCEAYGADVDEVRRGMCSDRRIGNQFFYPGLGYGGSCFPKDVLACVSMGKNSCTPTTLLTAVHEVNQHQRRLFLAKIDRHFGCDGPGAHGNNSGCLRGKRLAVWGIAFKPGTDDIREAPSLTLIEGLLQRGAEVVAFDPVAIEGCRRVFAGRVRYTETALDALDGADALVVCTNWDEFAQPDFEQVLARMRQAVIFDGRNLYRPQVLRELNITYYSVGRHPVVGGGRHEGTK